MITRRSLEGALKCALRDFRREEATSAESDIVSQNSVLQQQPQTIQSLSKRPDSGDRNSDGNDVRVLSLTILTDLRT